MHPKESFMPPLTNTLPKRLACILPHKLANHRLGDRMDDRRVSRLALTVIGDSIGRSVGVDDRTGRGVGGFVGRCGRIAASIVRKNILLGRDR